MDTHSGSDAKRDDNASTAQSGQDSVKYDSILIAAIVGGVLVVILVIFVLHKLGTVKTSYDGQWVQRIHLFLSQYCPVFVNPPSGTTGPSGRSCDSPLPLYQPPIPGQAYNLQAFLPKELPPVYTPKSRALGEVIE